jgi:hypothetical protein
MEPFSADATIFKTKTNTFFAPENIKNPLSKNAHNRSKFFAVLPTGPKPAQMSISVP